MKLSVDETLQTEKSLSIIDKLRAVVEVNAELRKTIEIYKQYCEALEKNIIERRKDWKIIQRYWDLKSNLNEQDDNADIHQQIPETEDLVSERLSILEGEAPDDADFNTTTPESELESENLSNPQCSVVIEKDTSITCYQSGNGGDLQPYKQEIRSHLSTTVESSTPFHLLSVPSQTTARILQGSWIIDTEAHPIITCAENLIKEGKMQKGLMHLDVNCPANKELSLYINATLLKSCALRSVECLDKALELAETALYIANLNELQSLIGKAQFYRGLAFFDMGLYAEAGHCLTRAASVRWFARDIEYLTREAEYKRKKLPPGTKGKVLDPNFQEIPITKTLGFGAMKK